MKTARMEVALLDYMGTDLTVVNAARVSFDKESDWEVQGDTFENHKHVISDKDAKLINYLAKHNHWTTFGHCFAQFRIKAPIFVARQLVKHQVGLVWNEVSRRYVDYEPEFWFPDVWRGRPEGSMKQGSSGEVELQEEITQWAESSCELALDMYNDMLAEGVAPEQARIVLPLNSMTEWYWSGSLAAWARVCRLRLDAHAQEETREIAIKINEEMSKIFPVAWKALMS
jgi:thymidylate synthase (FAD)